jgi:hypothetical protein
MHKKKRDSLIAIGLSEARKKVPRKRSRNMAATALLILDMMNRFDFPGGEALASAARSECRAIALLRTAKPTRGLRFANLNQF